MEKKRAIKSHFELFFQYLMYRIYFASPIGENDVHVLNQWLDEWKGDKMMCFISINESINECWEIADLIANHLQSHPWTLNHTWMKEIKC